MSDEKMEHSPLPWDRDLSGGPIVEVFDANCELVGEVIYQDAQFIVTACNSYYENKAAIAELVQKLGGVAASLKAISEAGNLIWARQEAGKNERIIRRLIAKHKAGE